MIWLRTFCQKSNIFGVKRRIGVVKFREVIFGFCVDEGVFEEILLVLLVELPHGDLVAVKGVVLGHLGHKHLQVEGA